jgi:Uma2 family endonuclease
MSLAAPVSPPPLLESDCLTSGEFLRRWEAMPDLKRAELIDGIVYMPSPVGLNHGRFEFLLNTWLGFYAAGTPGCIGSLEATWLMGERNVPQPDIGLMILPEYGGRSRIEGQYHAGAPELIVEVAVSSYSRDFGAKKRLYERMGVLEYVIAVPGTREVWWFELTPSGYRTLEPGSDGIFRSRCFPGLWLDAAALWDLDLARINAAVQHGLATREHAAFAAQLAGRSTHKPPSLL